MATEETNLGDFLEQNAPTGEFAPCAHYDRDADALTLYVGNEPEHGRRLNSRVTIYISDETGELVGCRIKGVRAVLEDVGSFDIAISLGKVKLKILFAALHGPFSTDPDSREVYRRLGKALHDSDIELEVPSLSG
ncbi:MAG: hypothetical protein WD847_04165 [Pirellulales bacterium]